MQDISALRARGEKNADSLLPKCNVMHGRPDGSSSDSDNIKSRFPGEARQEQGACRKEPFTLQTFSKKKIRVKVFCSVLNVNKNRMKVILDTNLPFKFQKN